MKKYLFFLIGIALIDVLFSLAINADLFGHQKELFPLRQSLLELRRDNNRLKRKVASFSSLSRIAKLAPTIGLTKEGQKLVIVSDNQFAMR